MAQKITKADLINEIYHSTNLPKKDISVIVDSLFSEIKNALCNGKTIELRQFGTFELRLRTGRQNILNPKTGKTASTEPHYVAAFKAGRELKQNLWSLKI